MPEMICCDVLGEMLADVGQRGFGVLVVKRDDGFRFWLQARAVEFESQDDSNAHLAVRKGAGEYVTLMGSVVITFCPFCGKSLQQAAEQSRSTVLNLAAKHVQFLSPAHKL